MLTAAELAELTGYRSPAWQAKWLRSHGWKFEQGRDGPKVLRAYRDARMGMESSTEKILEPAVAPTEAEIAEALLYKDIATDDGVYFREWGNLTPDEWYELNKPRFFFSIEQLASVKRHRDEHSPPDGPGIYFLFLGDGLQYIGKSKMIRERFYQHCYEGGASLRKTKWFTHWSAIWVPEAFLSDVEPRYISKLRPPRNVMFNGK